MRKVDLLSWTCLGLATLVLAALNLWTGYWQLAFVALAMLFLWVWGIQWKRRWVVTASLVGYSLVLVAGEWVGLWIGWSVVGLVLLLVAWDLQWFAWRIAAAGKIGSEIEFFRSHLLRLAAVAIFGLFLAGITLFIHLSFNFWIMVLLGFFVILGFQQWIVIARRTGG
jgi:hypothetical protein